MNLGMATGVMFVPLILQIHAPKPQETVRKVNLSPAVESVTGILRTDTVLGPPGYGENPTSDRKVKIYVIHLHTAVYASSGGGSHVKTDRLELFFSSDRGANSWDAAAKDSGKCMTITGLIRISQFGAEYTPLVLDVRQLQSVDSDLPDCKVPPGHLH